MSSTVVWKVNHFPAVWFYVKSILVDFSDFRRSKTAILTIFEALIFLEFHTWKCQTNPKVQKSELLKWSKWQFWGFNMTELISRKIWVAGYSKNFNTLSFQLWDFDSSLPLQIQWKIYCLTQGGALTIFLGPFSLHTFGRI